MHIDYNELFLLLSIRKNIDEIIINGDGYQFIERMKKGFPFLIDEKFLLKKEPLTDRQMSVFLYIIQYSIKNGMPPTRTEISLKFGFKSNNSSLCYLEALQKKGYLKIYPLSSRGILIL